MFEEISIVETYTYGSSARACSSPCSWSNSPPPSRLIELPSCFKYNQQKNMLKSLNRKIVLNFRATLKFLRHHPKHASKNVGFVGGCQLVDSQNHSPEGALCGTTARCGHQRWCWSHTDGFRLRLPCGAGAPGRDRDPMIGGWPCGVIGRWELGITWNL